MKRNYTISVLFFVSASLITTSSCSDTAVKEKFPKENADTLRHGVSKPPSNFQDTLTINKTSAVFYHADSLQLEKIREVTEAWIFDGSMHEFANQMRNAHIVLARHWPGVKVIEARNVRYLLFMKNNKETRCIDLDSKNDAYGLFLFDTHQDPELADMMNIDSELPRYFQKK